MCPDVAESNVALSFLKIRHGILFMTNNFQKIEMNVRPSVTEILMKLMEEEVLFIFQYGTDED